ncbi:MAG TPA: DUF2089 family protein [Candidatus Mcinerneyibacterium sp.]|nr:DUF2089 family protein [Candidatus Mcinerneyibacterium sp.]
MLEKCPICGGKIIIKEYQCEDCDVKISGKFEVEDFTLPLNEELMEFIKVFIYAEGNIKKVEGILNCSYPKVKSLLNKTKEQLNINYKNEENKKKKNEILEKLNNGEISFDEAMKYLNK